MTPSPQGTTPSQAPVMSREEWIRRLRAIGMQPFGESDLAAEKTLDAIMSLQAEVERLRKILESALAEAEESSVLSDTAGIRKVIDTLEKARQPK